MNSRTSKHKPFFTTLLKASLLFSLALSGGAALADDPPDRVGRVSLVQGQVDFRNDDNERPVAALVNWPITSQNVVSTANGARAELRVGSASVRIESDSELEVVQLDDQNFKLFLHYGSASVRVRNVDTAHDFELRTPQGKVLMLQPSFIRIDADRTPEFTGISVFSGKARFEDGGSSLVVNAGRHLDIGDGDIRTGAIARDGFDEWSLARDRSDEQSVSARYVSRETTGYEDLDRNGEWHVTAAYGAVWSPYGVSAGWAPYRDGRWTWVEPWGWTWVDNAPWGYAPSHYGRWLWLDKRWCWTPGRIVGRPGWAPALVGWIGGNNWNVRFSNGQAPGVGWFPLAPHERYEPGYRTSPAYLDRVNAAAVAGTRQPIHDDRTNHYRNRDEHNGVTLAPNNRFDGKTMVVGSAPAVLVPPVRFPATPNPTAQPIPRPSGMESDLSALRNHHGLLPERGNEHRNPAPIGVKPVPMGQLPSRPDGDARSRNHDNWRRGGDAAFPPTEAPLRSAHPQDPAAAPANAPSSTPGREHSRERLQVQREIPIAPALSVAPRAEERRVPTAVNADSPQRRDNLEAARAAREESARQQEERAPQQRERDEERSFGGRRGR